MLYSRAGDYPRGQPLLYAESFSPNTPAGACPKCHDLGSTYEVTEERLVPDASLTIRQRAVAGWPTAWQGQSLRDILTTMGIDVDVPWRELPRKTREWILFTDEQPQVPVYAGFNLKEARQAVRRKEDPSYMGTFSKCSAPRVAFVCDDAQSHDEAAHRALHDRRALSTVPGKASAS